MITQALKFEMPKKPITPVIIETEQGYFSNVFEEVVRKKFDMLSERYGALFLPPLLLPQLPSLNIPPPPLPIQLPFPGKRFIPNFNMFSLLSTGSDIKDINDITGVKTIFPNFMNYALDYRKPSQIPQINTEGYIPPGEVQKAIGVNVAKDEGWTGDGVTVAVIDTGYTYHPAIGDIERYSVEPHPVFDENGHSGFCLAQIQSEPYVSKSTGIETVGCCSRARMIAIKALGWGIGMGSEDQIVDAMSLAKELGADIVSMSLGSEAKVSELEDAECKIINDTKDDIIWVIAAGNSGLNRTPETIGVPGIAKNAITIGSWSHMDGDLSYFSSLGPTAVDKTIKPDCVSYGGGRALEDALPDETIYHVSSFGSLLDVLQDKLVDGFSSLHGTSMSTPLVAGLLTLVFEKAMKKYNHRLTTSDIFEVLEMNGHEKTNYDGFGLIKWDWFNRWAEEKLA